LNAPLDWLNHLASIVITGGLSVPDIYLTGGQQRTGVFLPTVEWHSAKKAAVLRLETDTPKVIGRLEYLTPKEACPDEDPGITFKAGHLSEDKLYVCTSTEVITFDLPGFRQIGYVSLPCFNDLHHVLPTPTGTLIVVVTGLDMVVELSPEGEILREWSVTGENTWIRFSREIDYRKVPTTKPHKSHPNFVFLIGDEIWTTRMQHKDAVCLTSPGERIDISVSFPHDGHVVNDRIYFTTVDGHVVIANAQSLKVEDVIDLNSIDNPEGRVLGWCRGLLPVTETLVWVGFTRVRPTKFGEVVEWVKGSECSKPTRIALYDFPARRCLREIELAGHGMDLVFSIIAASPVGETETLLARDHLGSAVEQVR
jgi:hypothetical protein